MIAQRFRPIKWVLGVAFAIMFIYAIQLQVANERGRLRAVEQNVVFVRKDIKRLQTEFATRASVRQLELWNSEAGGSALSTPQARQFVANEASIGALSPERFAGIGAAPPSPMVLANVAGLPATPKPVTGAKPDAGQVGDTASPAAAREQTPARRSGAIALNSVKPSPKAISSADHKSEKR